MKKNSKNGINLIALVCVVAVLLIISGTIIISFSNIYISTRQKEFANEIYSIQKLVDQYYFKHGAYPVKGESISFIDTSADVSINGKEIDLYEADINEVKRGTRNNSDEKDIYIVSDTGIVYYVKGENIGQNVYYTLTNDLKNKLGILK